MNPARYNLLTDLVVRLGLIMALVELVPVEHLPKFPTFVEVWVALFGRSESQSIAGICTQFWQSDWTQGFARRAIFDVARSRFPIHFRPLVRLLRAMTAAGFLDTDKLSTADHSHEGEGLDPDRELCDRHVYYYFDKLPTYSQVIPMSACTGAHALYEKTQERYGAHIPSPGVTYTNIRPVKLPGGTTLPARSSGRLLSGDAGDFIVVSWQHEHSGWKIILEILTEYINRKRMRSDSRGAYSDVSFTRRGEAQPIACRLEDIGVDMNDEGEAIVTDAFDLLRCVIQDNAALAEELLERLESGDPVVAHTITESQPPDLVQVTTMILEEALSRHAGNTRASPATKLITSAMSVLSALLALPNYSNRVWLYIRSTAALFGSDRNVSYASAALAAERVTGHYTMTLALLHLVQRLFHEASSSILTVLPDNTRLQQVKEQVLLRAARFIHSEIWVEHLGWKYAQLGDRFEIGRRLTSFYAEVLRHSPPALETRPFPVLSQTVAEWLLFKASNTTINPLVSSITTGGSLLGMLYNSRRFGDARRLIFLLESHLHLARLVLTYKQKSAMSSQPCLLEQAFCSQVTGGLNSLDPQSSKIDPVDVLAKYVKGRDMGNIVPLEATRVLYALCLSLSSSQPSPPTIIGHLSDPEATVTSMVRIVQHPYDELSLRISVWSFMSLAVDREPALANLFVTGRFLSPNQFSVKGKEVATTTNSQTSGSQAKPTSALDVALDIIANWKELWEPNAQLLASVLCFLDVVWQHGLELRSAIDEIRKDSNFWERLVSMACTELGPVPDYKTDDYIVVDGMQCSHLHEAVSSHAYRTISKSYALHIIGLDIDIDRQSQDSTTPSQKPVSFQKIETQFKSEDQLTDLVSEAAPSSYDPQLHDELMGHIKAEFPALTLEELRLQEPLVEREFGDDFVFSISLLQSRLQPFHIAGGGKAEHAEEVEKDLRSVNLNLCLTHSQTALAESWQFLLRQVTPYLRADSAVRPIVLAIASSVSFDIASEKRPGDIMATIHGTRLALLLGLVEVAWFSTSDSPNEILSFIELVNNVHGIILNEPQSPMQSFLGSMTVPFHRTLLQIIYFCSRQCRNLARRKKALNAEQRLKISFMHEATLTMVIDALRVVCNSARSRLDVELDSDMELLVAVFEQCTRPEVSPSSTLWLARCQETDMIRISLELFASTDLAGLSDLPLLLARRRPLYSPHFLILHMALASIPSAAERLASEGLLVAYSNNRISHALSAGLVDVGLPEFPGERSPAHRAYCAMLAIVAGVVTALGRHNHFFDAEASGFVQLYGGQISRALSWTISDPLTFPLLEEMEQTVNLFYAIAENAPSSNINGAVEKVLRAFNPLALLLLQQLNYALTHPNHLASVLEPVTADERVKIEKDSSSRCADPLKRPLIARLVHRLFKLSSVILSTLISISRADSVLSRQEEDWPVQQVLVVPVSISVFFLFQSLICAS
jgi:nuclear pore complex protein Nup188